MGDGLDGASIASADGKDAYVTGSDDDAMVGMKETRARVC